MTPHIVTFTTDFGFTEHYVGTMKGVVLGIDPTAHLVDICNAVRSYDVLDGAMTIAQAYPYFPADTVHVVVVDPGVGTARRPIVVRTSRHIFVAPDNGVLSFVYDREERVEVYHITSEHYFLQPVSNTFHGRDIFAAVAGHLSKGVGVDKVGPVITDYARFAVPRCTTEGNTTTGVVLRVDKFGNLVTNLTQEHVSGAIEGRPFKLTVGNATVTTLRSAYGQAASGEVFAIVGSMGYVEISANRAAAAQITGANRGSAVKLEV